MEYVSGEILTEYGPVNGYIGFERGIIKERGSGVPPTKPIYKGLIVPKLVNSHTHIGDSFIFERNIKLPRNIEKLVAPPNGIKHQLLESASDKEVIDGIEKSLYTMEKTGTSIFCDFRENGIKGINILKSCLEKSDINCLILSRPKKIEYDENEINILLKNSQGIGISSITDWDYSQLKKIASAIKKKKKIFALHASERIREDIDLILDLKPDILIHMTKATESDLIRVKENKIYIVVCPRSNAYFGLKPNIKLMKKSKVDILLGTDNAMINNPNVIEEVSYVMNYFNEYSIEELLQMITYIPRKALNHKHDILGLNSNTEFIVINKKNLHTLYVS